MFTNEEALVLVLGLLAVERLGLVSSGLAVEGALAKLDRVLPDALRDRLGAAQETLQLGLAHRPTARPRARRRRDGAHPQHGRPRRRPGPDPLPLGAAGRRPSGWSTPTGSPSTAGTGTSPPGTTCAGPAHLPAGSAARRSRRPGRASTRPEGFDLWEQIHRSMASVPYRWRAEVRLERLPGRGPAAGQPQRRDPRASRRRGRCCASAPTTWSGSSAGSRRLGVAFTVLSPPELRDAVLPRGGAARRLRRG